MTIEELEAKIKAQEDALKAEKAKVGEFRDNNIRLQHEIDTATAAKAIADKETADAKIATDEAAKAKAAADAAKLGNDKDDGALDAVAVDKAIAAQVKIATAETNKQLEELKAENVLLSKARKAQRKVELIDNNIRASATKLGVSAAALDDIVARSQGIWQVENDNPVAKDTKGSDMWAKDTTTPITIDQWVQSLSETAPHLFGTSEGTGAKNPKYDASTKTMNRQAFDAASQKDRASFFKDGGKLID